MDGWMFHLAIIFLLPKYTLIVSSFSLISLETTGQTRNISNLSTSVAFKHSITISSPSELYSAALFPSRLTLWYEPTTQDRMVFLLAMAISGDWVWQSILFWAMMPMLLRPDIGPVLIFVKNNFLKLLIFSRQPLVLRTVISFWVVKKGTPQTKGQMRTLLRMFQFQLTISLLVLPILQTSLELSRMIQKNRFIFYQFQILKLQPPPKRVMFTFFSFYSVSKLKPNPCLLNSKGMVGNFLSLSATVKAKQVLATFIQSFFYNCSGFSIQILQISLQLFSSSCLAYPKALQKYLLLAPKAECFLERPIFLWLYTYSRTTMKCGQSFLLRQIPYLVSVKRKKRMKLSMQAMQKESSLANASMRAFFYPKQWHLNDYSLLVRKLQNLVYFSSNWVSFLTERQYMPFSFSILLLYPSPTYEKIRQFSIMPNSFSSHSIVRSKNLGGKMQFLQAFKVSSKLLFWISASERQVRSYKAFLCRFLSCSAKTGSVSLGLMPARIEPFLYSVFRWSCSFLKTPEVTRIFWSMHTLMDSLLSGCLSLSSMKEDPEVDILLLIFWQNQQGNSGASCS